MPIASYQQPNDYSLVDRLRPFNLPYESTMQEIATKTQYWKVGADRIKSVYDQAVGLDPQFAQNKEYLKSFMEQANKNLTKISNSDLSISDNSQEAVNIFKPLYDTKNPFNYRLMEDSQLNKHYQKQQQLSDMYRTKDGGKEWNQNNDFYFRDAQQKYLQDAQNGNIDSIDSHYQNRKSYIPFYDGHKEVMDIQDACHGSAYETQGVASNNQEYFQQSSKKGCTPAELAMALKTGLSDRYRQQAYIDGYAHFKGNEDVLAKKFTDTYITDKQDQMNEIKATIMGMKNPDGTVSKNDQNRYTFYQNQLMELSREFDDSKRDYDKMTHGNAIEYVKSNYDKLAGQVYFGDLTNELATAYRSDDTKTMVIANPVGMLHTRLETDRANLYIKDNMDRSMEALQQSGRMDLAKFNAQKAIDLEDIKAQKAIDLARMKGELKGGSTEMPEPSTPETTDNIHIQPITRTDFINSDLVPAQGKNDAALAVLNDYVTKALGKQGQTLGEQELINYVTEQDNKRKQGKQYNENVINAYDDYKNKKYDLIRATNEIASVDALVKANHPEYLVTDQEFNDNKLVDYSLQTKGDSHKLLSIPISERDMFNIIRGKNVNGFTVGKEEVSTGPNPFGGDGPIYNPILLYHGRKVNDSGNKIGVLFRNTIDKVNNRAVDLNNEETKLFTQNYYQNTNRTVFNPEDFGMKKDAFKDRYDETFRSIFEIPGGLNDKFGYQITDRTQDGTGAYVRILDKNEGVAKIPGLEYSDIRKHGKGVKIERQPDGTYLVPNVFDRYNNLPNDNVLENFNKVKKGVKFIEQALVQDKEFKNSITVDSKELSVNGTERYVNTKGKEFIISVKKEKGYNGNDKISYVATYQSLGTGENVELEDNSIEKLLSQLEVK